MQLILQQYVALQQYVVHSKCNVKVTAPSHYIIKYDTLLH